MAKKENTKDNTGSMASEEKKVKTQKQTVRGETKISQAQEKD